MGFPEWEHFVRNQCLSISYFRDAVGIKVRGLVIAVVLITG